MVKKISSLFLLASVFLVMACSSDSDGGSGTKVKYRITTDSGMNISTINYRDADNEFVSVTASIPTHGQKKSQSSGHFQRAWMQSSPTQQAFQKVTASSFTLTGTPIPPVEVMLWKIRQS